MKSGPRSGTIQKNYLTGSSIPGYRRERKKLAELEILQGTINAVVYQNYDNGYAVLRLGVGGGQSVTVVGTIPLPAVGERLMVTGRGSSHASYGKPFEAEFLERLMPQSSGEILAYLSSRIIKGIGAKPAARSGIPSGSARCRVFPGKRPSPWGRNSGSRWGCAS